MLCFIVHKPNVFLNVKLRSLHKTVINAHKARCTSSGTESVSRGGGDGGWKSGSVDSPSHSEAVRENKRKHVEK
jgi:hypothetical protein